MSPAYIFASAFRSIRTNPLRAGLTLFGISIGIAAVMLIMSLGRSAEGYIYGKILTLGADVFVVAPGREPTGLQDVTDRILLDSLKDRDLAALLRTENAPHIADLTPIVAVTGGVTFETKSYRPQIFGADAEFFGDVFDIYPETGVLFGEDDIRSRAFVAVLGSEVARELFGDSKQGVGERITIKGRKFRVVGILPPRGQIAFVNFDEITVIPYTTAQTYLMGIDYFNEIIVRVDDEKNLAVTIRDVERTLRDLHGLEEGEEADFSIQTPTALVEQLDGVLGALTIFLSSIVAIALVVGGVGVMNIMLVAVTERTREIGLRKALGATERDILAQFLMETVVLSALGGVLGVLFGALLSLGAAVLLRAFFDPAWTYAFPFDAALLSIVVASMVGLIFGLYPARKASQKSPIEALRYE